MRDSDRVRDVVIAGGGVGGTIAGALLAARGFDVELFECGERFGGSASCFTHEGFRFDVGASLFYGLLGEGRLALVRRAAEAAGVDVPAVPDSTQIHYRLPGGREVRAHRDAAAFQEELTALFPAERRGIREFYGTLNRICDALDRAYVESLDDARLLFDAARSEPRSVATIIRSSLRDTASLARRHVRSPDLRRFIDLECYCRALADASRTPLINAAIVLSDRHRGGIAYPVGGSGAIANAFVRGLERHGGCAHLHSPVDEILLEGGRASGVRLRCGRVVRARAVVSNVPLRATLERLLPTPAGARSRKRLHAFPDADSWFTVWAGSSSLEIPAATHHAWWSIRGRSTSSLVGRSFSRFLPFSTGAPHRTAGRRCTRS